MKKCSRCKRRKPLEDFHKKSRSPDGRQPLCKICNGKQMKKYYKGYTDRHRDLKKAYRQRNWDFLIDYLKTHPCVDCGETDIIVLEFDHVRGTKVSEVTKMAHSGGSLDLLKAEVAKCEIRCANDHRRKTAKTKGRTRKLVALAG